MESKPTVCVALCESSIDALANAATRAADVGDLVELRLDCLKADDFNSSMERLESLIQKLKVPTIITYRPAEQGGSMDSSLDSRFAFWAAAGNSLPSHLRDLELDVVQKLSLGVSATHVHPDWNRIICSQHDFDGVPSALSQVYEALAATPARILKLAVRAHDVTDCLPVFQILDRGLKDGREMIAIAMGPAGIATRVLGPSRGAFLTYAALEGETGTAPGQVSARELKEMYRIDKLDRQTQIFGVMGFPVSHSISPLIHNAALQERRINAVYLPFEVRDVVGFIKRMIHPRTRELAWAFRGLSVTAPHKSAVMNQLDWIDKVAEEIGAVNTITVKGTELHGYNTDAHGLIKPLVQKFGDLRGARCAILGAGGAARATIWGLRAEGATLTVFARSNEKGAAVSKKFDIPFEPLNEASFDGFDVVINTTPLGTIGDFETEAPATANQLRGARLAYDLVYNPTATRFLSEARLAGCETLGGLPMLITQAAEQFRLWTGAEAPEEAMFEVAARSLSKNPNASGPN
jgi:3-dehydroquinate dehydratase/shikimate dehydrogenase